MLYAKRQQFSFGLNVLKWNGINESQQNVKEHISNFSVSTVPVDGPALLCAWTSACKVMTKLKG